METFPALLVLCARNSAVPGDFPSQRPVTRSFDIFFDLYLLSRGWWFETPSRSLWRHCIGHATRMHFFMSKRMIAIYSNLVDVRMLSYKIWLDTKPVLCQVRLCMPLKTRPAWFGLWYFAPSYPTRSCILAITYKLDSTVCNNLLNSFATVGMHFPT